MSGGRWNNKKAGEVVKEIAVPMEVDEGAKVSPTSYVGRILSEMAPGSSGSQSALPPPPPPMPSVEKAASDVDDESIADLSTAATSDVASKKWLKRQRQKLAKSSGAAAAGPGGDFFLVTEAKLLEAKVGAKTGGEGGSSAWRLPAGVKPDPKVGGDKAAKAAKVVGAGAGGDGGSSAWRLPADVKPDPKAGKEEGMVLVGKGGGRDAMKKVAVKDTYSRGAYPNWPLVDCRGCGTDIKWRFAEEERVLTKRGTLGPRTFMDDVDDEFALFYWCAVCKAKEWGCELKEAQLRIIQERPCYKRHQDQASRFKEADAKVAEAIPGMSKGERRTLAIEDMRAVLAPLGKFILLKRKVLLRQGEAVERFRQLEDKLKNLASVEEIAAVTAEMEAMGTRTYIYHYR